MKRRVDFRDFSEEDTRYLYALHKSEGLPIMNSDERIQPKAFKDEFMERVAQRYDYAWTATAGGKPIGFTFAIQLFEEMIIGDTVWMPWTSPRTRVVATVRFLNALRKGMNGIMVATTEKHKRFLEHVCKYGIARRIGTKLTRGGEKHQVFQTRPED